MRLDVGNEEPLDGLGNIRALEPHRKQLVIVDHGCCNTGPELHLPDARTLRARDEARDAMADRLEAIADSGDTDPLLASLGDVSYTINRQEHAKRLLLAYARQFVPGRGYTLEALAEATGMSASGIRTAYKQADIEYVAGLIRVGH